MRGKIDYDRRLHSVYERGRALPKEAVDTWMAELARHVDQTHPLKVLDLGSGTGRFSRALAKTFGGPVYAVEPSEKMISVAATRAADPRVHYLRGIAEAIPLRDRSVDVAALYFVLHHIANKQRGAAELARVMRPNGTLFIRMNFSDRMPDAFWYQFFDRAKEVDASMSQPVEEVTELFKEASFQAVALEEVEFVEAANKRELFDRLRYRAASPFELMDDEEIEEGMRAMERAVDHAPDSEPVLSRGDLLVLRRA
jgi:ubiquinone/menaquinone biosynthesis C-methylase UbiE